MDIDVVHQDKEKLVVLLKDITPAFANTIRRAIIDRVPTMAIEDVEFRKNTSSLYDEMIAHRLGLLPLTTDLSLYMVQSECKCGGEGCARCTVKLTLQAKGPGAVTAELMESKDPKIKPVFGKMSIVNLLKGQEIELEATAILGRGKEHAKWSPGLAHYKEKPIIELGKVNEDIVEKSSIKIFKIEKGKVIVDETALYTTTKSIDSLSSLEGVSVKKAENEFIFHIESWGQLSPKDILLTALEEIQNAVK